MKPADPGEAFTVRAYEERDERRVLDLLKSVFGEWPTDAWMLRQGPAEFFRWKHMTGPFGRSLMLVAEADGQIVAFRALMHWQLAAGDRPVPAVRGVDSATHRHYRRRGLWSRLQREADEAVRGDAHLFFTTAGEMSLPGHLKLGRHLVAKLPVSVRIRRPIRCAVGARSGKAQAGVPMRPARPAPAVDAEIAAEALDEREATSALLAASGGPGPHLATQRSVDYLRWRYAPLLDYRAIREQRAGRLVGLAIFRVCPRGVLWESRVTELIVPVGDRHTARRLLRRVAAAAPVDLLTCHFPARSSQARAAARSGFIPSPARTVFVANPFRHDAFPDPTDRGSWALSLGDLELF